MPDIQRHILGVFEDAIQELKADIRRMADLALINISSAVRGLLERNEDLCNRAIASDEDVDTLEKRIDREGLQIIMKFSPMGRDLRRVISTMKMCSSLERISDYAVSLARRAKKVNATPPQLPEVSGMQRIYELASTQLRDAVTSFCDENLQLALHLQGRDAELDEAQAVLNEHLIERMKQDPERIRDYMDLILCSRYLERIGDQSVNIAEDAVYLMTAFDIRHGGELPPTPAA